MLTLARAEKRVEFQKRVQAIQDDGKASAIDARYVIASVGSTPLTHCEGRIFESKEQLQEMALTVLGARAPRSSPAPPTSWTAGSSRDRVASR